jgi:hypothetical protein
MIDIKKYQEDFDKLGINDKKEQLEILNSLLRLAIIMQDNYNNIYNKDRDEEYDITI